MSVNIADLVTTFSGNTKDLDRSFRKVERETETHVSKVNKILGKISSGVNTAQKTIRGNYGGDSGFLSTFSNVSNIIQGIPQIGQLMGALISPITGAAEAGIKFNMFMETSQLGFETLIGNAQKAKEHMAALAVFGDRTPFQFEDLVAGSQYLQGMKFAADEVIPSLTAIGDTLTAKNMFSADSINSVITALGQMRLKGKLSAEEMTQLAEHGVESWDLLARAIGKTTQETMKLVSQGKLKAKESTEAILAMAELKYKGMMEKQSQTLRGRMSTAEDLYQRATGMAMQGTTANISEMLGAALQKGDLVTAMAGSLNSAITPLSGFLTSMVKGVLGGGITSGLTDGINAGKDMVKQTMLSLGLDSVMKPFKALLDINSPSGVFYDYGLACAMGFNDGYQDGMKGGGSNKDEAAAQAVKKMREALEKAASTLGVSPVDLAAIIGFETGGTFSPKKWGGEGGNYLGLIQFGKDERRQFGANSKQTFEEQLLNSVVPFFQKRFEGVGMKTQGADLLTLYRTVIGGNPLANIDTKDAFKTTARSGAARIAKEFIPLVMKMFFSELESQIGGLEMFKAVKESSTIGGLDMFKERSEIGGLNMFRSQPGGLDMFKKAIELPTGTTQEQFQNILKSMPEFKAEKLESNLYRVIDTTKILGEAVLSTNKGFQQLGEGEWLPYLSQKVESLTERFRKMRAEMPTLHEQLSDTFVKLPEQISDVFGNAVAQWDGTFKGFFRSIGLGFADMMRQMAAELIRFAMLKLILGIVTSIGGGAKLPTNNTSWQQIIGLAPLTSTPGFANGGRPPVGLPLVIGRNVAEEGLEVFVPDQAGTILNHRDSMKYIQSWKDRAEEHKEAMRELSTIGGSSSVGVMNQSSNSSSSSMVNSNNDNRVININVSAPMQQGGSKLPPPSERQIQSKFAEIIASKFRGIK